MIMFPTACGNGECLSASYRLENIDSAYVRLNVTASNLSGVLHRLIFSLLNGITPYCCHRPG